AVARESNSVFTHRRWAPFPCARSRSLGIDHLAEEIAANAPLATQSIKRDIDAFADAGLGAALDRVAMSAALTLTSQDIREGYTAKAERREPRFDGK
ncbi:hypothetical protein ABZS88_23590, partial [Streptomyces sp. NPDC005480]